MPEKLYGFTHLISETKLLALIASHADEVKVEIFDRRPKNMNGHLANGHLHMDAPPMLEPPAKKKAAKYWKTTKPKAKNKTTKMSAAKFVMTHLYENRDAASITLAELETAAKSYKIPVARISTCITPMVQRRAIKRVGKGSYKIGAIGIAEIEKERDNPRPEMLAIETQGTSA